MKKALKVVGTIVKWYAIMNTLSLAAIGFMDIILDDEPVDCFGTRLSVLKLKVNKSKFM